MELCGGFCPEEKCLGKCHRVETGSPPAELPDSVSMWLFKSWLREDTGSDSQVERVTAAGTQSPGLTSR